jgi:hypothetical protein
MGRRDLVDARLPPDARGLRYPQFFGKITAFHRHAGLAMGLLAVSDV